MLADYADIQSGWLLTHTRRVAELAVDAARQLDMGPDAQRALRQAALLHDIGRVGVSTHVWDHPGPLGHSDLDRVRLHGSFTAQILRRAPTLAARDGVAALACAAHERLDGSGYARGLDAPLLTLSHRVLAAADVVAALTEARAHRPAYDIAGIERIVGEEVRCGRLDRDACHAVLAVLGARLATAPTRATTPAGLSERECEVLAELSKGRTNKEIARALGISPKTVGHQVQAIYRKAGVHTRAGATLFAMEQGLLRRLTSGTSVPSAR